MALSWNPKTWVASELVDHADMNLEIRDHLGAVVRVLDRDVTVTTVASTVTETTVYTYTIPANTLSTDRAVRLTHYGLLTNNTGVDRTPTIRLKFGGTTLFAYTPTLTTNATGRLWTVHAIVAPANATNAQRTSFESMISTPTADANLANADGHGFGRHFGLTVDTTATVTIAVTMQHSVSDANMTYAAHTTFLELMP